MIGLVERNIVNDRAPRKRSRIGCFAHRRGKAHGLASFSFLVLNGLVTMLLIFPLAIAFLCLVLLARLDT